jgi:hypothetical protein
MGKTGITTLKPADKKMLGTLTAGDEVALKSVGSRLTVETMAGEYVSDVEPKLALRLTKLMSGGNTYAAAIAGRSGDGVRVIIKETFQHPTQVGRLSFPAGKAGDVVRPYTKESMVRADLDDDEDYAEEAEEWDEAEAEGESDAEPREVNIFDVARTEDADEPEFDE